MTKKRSSSLWKYILLLILLIFIVAAFLSWVLFSPHALKTEEETFLYIPDGAVYSTVLDSLHKRKLLSHPKNFNEVAKAMNYPEHIYAGKYKLTSDMSNFDLVRLLHSGKQTPVRLVINKERTKADVAQFLSSKLAPDSIAFMKIFEDSAFLRHNDFNRENAICAIIPNTYQFFWNTDAQETYKRLVKERNTFWNASRRDAADSLGLRPNEVYILASIVEEETNQLQEKPLIASVYLNRLSIGMKLGADPTIKFALKDFALKRVTGKELSVASPYNTYIHKGLPPGPICTPSIKTIDAVLKAPKTDYYYFTAKADLSGTHVFEETYSQHIKHARAYHKALNKLNIK